MPGRGMTDQRLAAVDDALTQTARELAEHIGPHDTAVAFLAVGAHTLAAAKGKADAVVVLRSLADALEQQEARR